MRLLAAASAAAVLLCAGCGGSSRAPRPAAPQLPRALAQAWSREARAIAEALDAGDACTAKQRSQQLRSEVIAAVNAESVPPRFLEPLTSAVNALPERIVCTPPAPAQPPAEPPKDHGKHKGEHKHEKKHGHDHGDEQ